MLGREWVGESVCGRVRVFVEERERDRVCGRV